MRLGGLEVLGLSGIFRPGGVSRETWRWRGWLISAFNRDAPIHPRLSLFRWPARWCIELRRLYPKNGDETGR